MPDVGSDSKSDTADFYHATIFSDDDCSGLGSWGDPNNDFQICTGGFKDMKLSYPVPHGIRRNYTLYFSLPPEFPSPPDASAPDPSLMMNTTFTTEVVNSLLTSFTGNYSGFQATLENYPGPHTGPHLSLGGDLVGLCPFGLKPPNCNPGMKWAPNGEADCRAGILSDACSPSHRPFVLPSSRGLSYRQFHPGRN